MLNVTDLAKILTGKSRIHLVPLPNDLSSQHFLQVEVVEAFLQLQKSAKQAGFNLQPASTYRDFERQKLIWNDKFNGKRKVHDDTGEALDLTGVDEWYKCQAILRWSAVPGASRHHWGTEIDIFDPDLLPEGQKLMLEPWEYQTGGYFQYLIEWLLANAKQFGFYFPFMEKHGKQIGLEPWHISYYPIAKQYEQLFSPEILQISWIGENLAGKQTLNRYLSCLFKNYIL